MDDVLVICSHPDDESLGCAGTMLHLGTAHTVHVATFTDGVGARGSGGHIARYRHFREALHILGAQEVLGVHQFEDNAMDQYPLLEIAKAVESIVRHINPAIVLTHHVGDLNVDHQMVAKATMVALRPYAFPNVKCIYSYEVPSSTEWGTGFVPTAFVALTQAQMDAKLAAVQKYVDEVRTAPHPRSPESILARAQYWGSISGSQYAEPLMVLREVL